MIIKRPEARFFFCFRTTYRALTGFVLLLILFTACRNSETESSSGSDAMEEMAKGLPGGSSMLLNSLESEISWTIRQNKGGFLKGTFKPERGFLLMEGRSLAGGFWEGDFFSANRIIDSSNTGKMASLQFLKDSIPALFRPGGNRIRMDLRQISRVIPRSEFRSSTTVPDSQFPSHDVYIQAEIADSSGGMRFPVKVLSDSGRVQISGHYQLNLREFGILVNPVQPKQPAYWIPEVSLEFRLIFRREKNAPMKSAPEKS